MYHALELSPSVAEPQPPYLLQTLWDWEWKEQMFVAMEAAKEREELLQAAFVLAPKFKLFPLERNWWVARIDEPLVQLFDSPFPEDKKVEGAKETHLLDPQTLIVRSDLPATRLLENIEMLFLPF